MFLPFTTFKVDGDKSVVGVSVPNELSRTRNDIRILDFNRRITMDPTDVTNPLAPIFAASLAVQQVLEVVSMPLENRVGKLGLKSVLGIIGFVIGIILAYTFDLNVMEYFKVAHSGGLLDKVVTALILSAGTEGTNSLVKFLKYLKEDKKATAAETLQSLRDRADEAATTTTISGARGTLDKLRKAAGRKAPGEGDTPAGVPKTPVFTFISQQ